MKTSVNVDKCLLVPKEEDYDTQEREEDAFSMNFANYDFTEQEEGHKDEDYSTATERNKEMAPTTDVAQKRAKTDPVKNWVDSWAEKTDPISFVWVNVYGYYRKENQYGGYGVIVRDRLSKPIVAAAKCSEGGNSAFYHVLMGVQAGISLAAAENSGLNCIYVICNSYEIALIDPCRSLRCRDPEDDFTCHWCLSYFNSAEECNASLRPLKKKLKAMRAKVQEIYLDGFPTVANRAAKYIAKMGEKKRPKAQFEIKPSDLPKGLKVILWQDAFDTLIYGPN